MAVAVVFAWSSAAAQSSPVQVDDGRASHEAHWAYRRPRRPLAPAVLDAGAVWNPIDAFVLARLEAEQRGFAPVAEPARLIRRVYLDVIGLPPTPEDVDAFVADPSRAHLGRIVDRLLASPRFGEHQARLWLDLARYADSNGFQADQLRESWAYRDWVIDALNRDLPFDQFTIEQLAGDLLPDATLAQKVATGFHRTVVCNVEAGVHPEANRTDQVVDRVNTTATVWLGTTMECAQCHDHKYDPFSQRDYYRLFAFFNNTPIEVENPNGDVGVQFNFSGPWLELPHTPAQAARRRALEAERDALLRAAAADGSADEKALAAVEASLQELAPPKTLVMVEQAPPRETHVMMRGDYLRPAARVEPGTPEVLHDFDDSWPQNRLGLARWLVSADNPLVARVTVNRWWSQVFGRGLVATEEDFGSRGDAPSHPQLLDWLAVEFVESGWSRKHMLRLLVTSRTYCQSSRRVVGVAGRDVPLARGPRFRMSAEMIRDNALAIAGLLRHEVGGPPVFPPQPPGLWRQTGRNEPKYVVDTGADRFRRGIYVIWRRAAPYPSFVLFDGPDRASCHPRRSRTNTPMQALALMNDTVYVEAALGLAQRAIVEAASVRDREPDAEAIVRRMFRLALARRPNARELELLLEVFRRERSRYAGDPAASAALVDGYREVAIDTTIDRVELVAGFYVATILLNLDETITKG